MYNFGNLGTVLAFLLNMHVQGRGASSLKGNDHPQVYVNRYTCDDFHETWYVASETPAHHSSNDDHGVTLTYFTARSNLVT